MKKITFLITLWLVVLWICFTAPMTYGQTSVILGDSWASENTAFECPIEGTLLGVDGISLDDITDTVARMETTPVEVVYIFGGVADLFRAAGWPAADWKTNLNATLYNAALADQLLLIEQCKVTFCTSNIYASSPKTMMQFLINNPTLSKDGAHLSEAGWVAFLATGPYRRIPLTDTRDDKCP